MDKDATKHTLLNAALKLAIFDGWSDAMIQQACTDASITESEYIRSCPNGAIDLITTWFTSTDTAMIEWAENTGLSNLKVRERIRALVLFRLEHFTEHREAIRRAYLMLLMPPHAPTNLQLLHQTVDTMWLLAGDNSNDYNWYTKRFLLSGVYTSTLMYWLSDESADFNDTKAFLERRIENVVWLGGMIGKVVQKAA